jgi:hypothetical protein
VGLIPPNKFYLIYTEIVELCSEFLGAGTEPVNTALWIMLALTDATELEDAENSKGNLMLQLAPLPAVSREDRGVLQRRDKSPISYS